MPSFQRPALFDDEELQAIQEALCRDPEAGDLLQGGHGLRKLRARLSGQGKRSGARVIYYLFARDDVCYLVFAYRKSRQENLTDAQVKALSAVMQEVLGDER